MMRKLPVTGFLILVLAVMTALSLPVRAEDKVPEMPLPLQTMAAQGAQIRYLGRDHGLDGWITILRGKEQYFYVTQDGEAMLMGLLFDKSGKLVTVEQVKALRGGEGGSLLDSLTQEESAAPDMKKTDSESPEFKTPAEKMFQDVENSNWIPLGNTKAPVIYVFVDPQCPHCHDFMQDLRKDYIEAGKIQVRIIPIGFRDETIAQAAYLLASPNPAELWFKHLDGDKNALPAKEGINEQGIQMNLAVMQAWKFNVTPITVYRSKNGSVKLIRGRAEDAAALYADLP